MTKEVIFIRTKSRHYFQKTKTGRRPVTLETLRRYIHREKPFKVFSATSGKDMTAKAIAHAIAYQYVKKRRFVSEAKKAQKVLRG